MIPPKCTAGFFPKNVKQAVMNRYLLRLVLLFVITFLILTAYSFYGKLFKFWGITIETTDIAEVIRGEEEAEFQPYDSLYVDTTATKTEEKPQIDSTSQRILLIGDSMLEGLMLRLHDYVKYNDHKLKVVIWYSSTTKWFGETDTLGYFIDQFNPDYVMLVLGANELFIRDIIERRNPYVKNILKTIGQRKFIWIGPPNWTDDTGINELIKKNVGEGRYFPSKDLEYDRYEDGAHPTKKSAAKWMDSVATWTMEESRYPILLEEPDTTYKGRPDATLLQPLD